MAFLASLIISTALMVVGELIRPKPRVPNEEPAGLDDFDFPTAEEGRALPLVVGKVLLKGPNVTWYGDLLATALTRRVRTGLFSSKRQTFGYRYHMGAQLFLCRARADFEIHEIRFGENSPQSNRVNEANGVVRFDYDDVNFFGGDEKEGGVKGVLRFYRGSELQTENPYFSTQIGETAPAYRGYSYIMLERMYLGTSPNIKPISCVVSTYPNTLGVLAGRHQIGEDANPVCFAYEILNDAVWGLGVNPSRIDRPAFVAAADTVFSEGYGVSMIVNASSSAGDLLSEVLRHIDGVIFTDPSTGLITIGLARGDYDVSSLPRFTPDDFLEGIKFSRASWSQTKNTVKISYISRANGYKEASLSHQDLANIVQREGEIAAEDFAFRGFATAHAANLAAARVLKTYSYPLAKVTCAVTRKGWALRPGRLFRLDWPLRGINGVVFRIVSINYGGLRDNRIEIDAVEDIFSISRAAYLPPEPTSWVDPISAPTPLVQQALVELPYPLAPVDGSTLATFGARARGLDENYRLFSDRAPPHTDFQARAVVSEFTASAVTTSAVPLTSASRLVAGLQVDQVLGIDTIDPSVSEAEMLLGGSLILVVSAAGQEWMAYRAVETIGSSVFIRDVLRGVLDTVPLDHPVGARVWFAATGYGVENEGAPYTSASVVAVRLLPANAKGVLPLGSATEMQITTTARGSRPFVPGRVRVNGTHPANLPGTPITSLAVTWAHRSRFSDRLVTQDEVGHSPETGTTYRLVARREDTNALLAEGVGDQTSASVTLNYTGLVRLTLTAERGGLASGSAHHFTVNYQATGTPANSVAVSTASYVLDGGGA